jgi:hypothetical protein
VLIFKISALFCQLYFQNWSGRDLRSLKDVFTVLLAILTFAAELWENKFFAAELWENNNFHLRNNGHLPLFPICGTMDTYCRIVTATRFFTSTFLPSVQLLSTELENFINYITHGSCICTLHHASYDLSKW